MGHIVEKKLKASMFVIGEGDSFRGSKFKDGKNNWFLVGDISEADMFQSRESARDHLVFKLQMDKLIGNETVTIQQVTLNQTILTEYQVDDSEIVSLT